MDGLATAPRPRLWRLALWGVLYAAWASALLTPRWGVESARTNLNLTPDEGFWTGKFLHVGVYAFLAASAAWVPARPRWILLALLSLHAVATETIQPFVGRTGSLRDVGLDHLGILAGLGVASWRWRRP
jgi:VanZ family protein